MIASLSDTDLQCAIDEKEFEISQLVAQHAELKAEQARRIEAKQKACAHPDGFPGFLIGVCPHCGLDDY